MTDRAGSLGDLHGLAIDFTKALSSRIRRIIPTTAELSALMSVSGDDGLVSVGFRGDQQFRTIPLTIGGVHHLDLLLKLHCCWDRGGAFLAIEESWFHVVAVGRDRTPLFRLEYVRRSVDDVPSAHCAAVHSRGGAVGWRLPSAPPGNFVDASPQSGSHRATPLTHRQVHAHRDEVTFRFLSCVEDLLHFLVIEFGIDRCAQWRVAAREGREQWRRVQLTAAVRDAPEEAREALELLGYRVERPEDGPREARRERLQSY